MTNQDLINFHNEISQWKQRGSILVQFNRSRITEFYRWNANKINTVNGKLLALCKAYFQYEEVNGEQHIKFEGEGKDRKPVFLEGKTEEDFNIEKNELMGTLIDMKF